MLGGAGEYDADVVSGQCFVFQKSLAACAAWGYGGFDKVAVGVACGYCYGLEPCVGICGSGIVGCCAFGACAGWVCHVFLVGSGDCLSVVEFYRRSYGEVAVGRIGAVGGFACQLHEPAVGGRQVIGRCHLDGYCYVEVFHYGKESGVVGITVAG